MSTTFPLRQKLIDIHRKNVGKVEQTKNRAPWIGTLWPATSYPDGMANREPYCAAGMAWGLREWLKLPEVLSALKMTAAQAEKWRCKSAGAFAWGHWARDKGLMFVPNDGNFHTGDIVVYTFSHVEVYVDDVKPGSSSYMALGYNTDAGNTSSNEGEGCFIKARTRGKIKEVFRILP